MNKQIEEMAKCEDCLHFRACNIHSEYVPSPCYLYENKKGYRKQEWISVEERLPDRDTQVLVVYDDGFMMIDHMPIDDGVPYWMPLPMPPKGDEGK